jgi:peptide/nickel transport system substrate-binding protein
MKNTSRNSLLAPARRRLARVVASGIAISALFATLVLPSTVVGTPAVATAASGGGTATFALPANSLANYILPLEPIADATPQNVQLMQYLIYRPLYNFGSGTANGPGPENTAALNLPLSLAKEPVYSDSDKVVTVTLDNYKWSDGQPVTTRDVQFWETLVTANKTDWFSYVPGEYPDNIVKTTVLSPTKIQFTLNKAYSPTWFTYNELSQITPLPQHIMDKTSASGKVGNYDLTTSGAKQVYAFLSGQAKNERTYTTNKLWSVIDGPWRLTSFNGTTGLSTYAFNSKYSGPVDPNHITKFVEQPYTTDTAEYNALRSGTVDYGYIPQADAALHTQLSNYNFVPWQVMVISFGNVNQNNPTVGPIFKQAYIRQAIETLIDQKGIIKTFYAGYGTPTCGPVPATPKTPWASSYEKSCPYGYNPAKAVSLLKSHGWNVVPGGVSSCSDPAQCGPGIKKGARLEFNFVYSTGNTAFENSIATIKSDAEKAGFKYDLKGEPFGSVVSLSAACGPGTSSPKANCDWQMSDWGGWGYEPDYYPTGDLLFVTGAGANYSSYSNAKANQLIAATQLAGDSTKAMNDYEAYMVDQVPFIWGPNRDFQLSEINKNLQGTTPQNAEFNIWPELWHYGK